MADYQKRDIRKLDKLSSIISDLIKAGAVKFHSGEDRGIRDTVTVTDATMECPRYIAFQYSGERIVEDISFDAVMRMRYGMMMEEFVLNAMIEAGVDLDIRDEDGGQHLVRGEIGGVPVRGRLDAIVRSAPFDGEFPAVMDIKTAPPEKIDAIRKRGWRYAKRYADQIRLYQHLSGMFAPGWLVFVSRGDPWIVHVDLVPYDGKRIGQLALALGAGWRNRGSPWSAPRMQFAERGKPPCSFCKYAEKCWGPGKAFVHVDVEELPF